MLKFRPGAHAGSESWFRLIAQRFALSVTAILAAVFVAACGGGGSGGNGGGGNTCTVTGVAVSGNPATMATGATATLTATVNATASCSGAVTWSASPAGGTLTPSGNTATFTANTAGTYVITATSTADPTKNGTATETVNAPLACGQPNGTVVNHTVNVAANETWLGDGVTHMVPNSISITGAAVVTVQPCAIVALGQGATITVTGTAKLLAAGTSNTRFVTFQRADINQPWGILRGASATSMIELHWTIVQGGGAFGGQLSNPGIAAIGPGYSVPPAAVLKVDNVVINSPQGVGVYLDANAAFTADSQNLFVTGAGNYAVMTTMMSLGSIPVGGTYTGNAIDEVLIFGPNANVFANMTIHDLGVPVRIPTASMTIAPAGGATAPVTLTIDPGVVLKFPKLASNAPGARVIFGTNGNSPNNLVGVLNAMGTPQKPIVFTSGETVPAPGDWVGLWLNTATNSRLDNVEISYAGAPSGIQSSNCRPLNTPDNAALIVGDFETQYVPPAGLITNSLISNSASYGIDAVWQSASFNDPNLTAGNIFQNNARCAQTYNAVAPPGICPAQRGCTAN